MKAANIIYIYKRMYKYIYIYISLYVCIYVHVCIHAHIRTKHAIAFEIVTMGYHWVWSFEGFGSLLSWWWPVFVLTYYLWLGPVLTYQSPKQTLSPTVAGTQRRRCQAYLRWFQRLNSKNFHLLGKIPILSDGSNQLVLLFFFFNKSIVNLPLGCWSF